MLSVCLSLFRYPVLIKANLGGGGKVGYYYYIPWVSILKIHS